MPDPDTLLVGDDHYVYVTNSELGNVPVLRSDDLTAFEHVGDALPRLPDWARRHFTWAPEVTHFKASNSYVLYFTARHGSMQCIGVATSAAPEGPFDPVQDGPLICPIAEGGAIDASTFEDVDGRRYLLWKNDGNCCGIDTWISIQELSEDGMQLVGEPTRLIQQDLPWEGKVVEAPTLWLENGKYYLFYSANAFNENYAMGYAVADDVRGPYTKSETPLLSSSTGEGLIGPGGQDLVRLEDGSTVVVYHSWSDDMKLRGLNVDELRWTNGVPEVVTGCAAE
ncbi:glycoside hydrolase family 43 protein [Devosia albogilva]|uniref:Glycoside hydrolase family 43 protein n=1 Tax=Devosia albogilva TaxID=429726 RepID=A0ABW5QNJ6_9HYPH